MSQSKNTVTETKNATIDGRTNEDIVADIQAGNNVMYNKEVLCRKNEGLVAYCIKAYISSSIFANQDERDEYMQEGYVGLLQAAMAYKVGDSKFTTYAAWYIRKNIYAHLRFKKTSLYIPSAYWEGIVKFRKATRQLDAEGKEITFDNISQLIDVTPQTYQSLLKANNDVAIISLAVMAADDFFFPAYRLAMSTGMRFGEVFGLAWDDIDFDKKIIHVRHTLKYMAGKGYYLETPKTKASLRDIPITDQAAAMLKEHRKNQLSMKMKLGAHWKAVDELGDLAFKGRFGAPVSIVTVNRSIKQIASQMVSEGYIDEVFTFHTFRTTFATRAIEAGMNPKTLQVILGHSSIQMTMDIYARVEDSTKANEMNMIADAIDLSGNVSRHKNVKEG